MGRFVRRGAYVLLAILLLVAPSASAGSGPLDFGGNDRPSHSVSTGDGYADVAMRLVLVDGQPVFRPGSSQESDRGCRMEVTRIPILEAIPIAEGVFDDAVDIRVRCGEGGRNYDTWVFVPDADTEARDLARDYVERVLAPEVAIGTSPSENLLVGLPTWFWLDGWDGATRTTTVAAPWGDALDLHLTVDQITWDYGDGSPTHTGGPGQAYPVESDIRHTYTHASTTRTEPDAAYPLSAQLTIGVTYTYGPYGPITVDPIELTIERPVRVNQLQAVLQR